MVFQKICAPKSGYFYSFLQGETLCTPFLGTFILFWRGRPPAPPPPLVLILVFLAGGDPLQPPVCASFKYVI